LAEAVDEKKLRRHTTATAEPPTSGTKRGFEALSNL